MLPLTVGRFRVFEPGLKCSVAELTLCRTFQTALAHSKAPDHERDHRSGGASALHRHNVKASKWSTSRRRRRWRRARRWSVRRQRGAEVRSPAIPAATARHVNTLRFAGSPGAMLLPAAQQPVSSRAHRRTLDRPTGRRVQADHGSTGSGGRRGRRQSAMSCWPAPCRTAAVG